MVIIYIKSSFVGDLRKMMTNTFNQLKIGQLLSTKSAFNLNAPKKDGLPTSAALGLSAVAHLIVALVLFQQINLTPISFKLPSRFALSASRRRRQFLHPNRKSKKLHPNRKLKR